MKVTAINTICEKMSKNSQWFAPLAIFLLIINDSKWAWSNIFCEIPAGLKSAVAILISAGTGASIALYSILRNVQVQREKATLDMIQKNESDDYYISILAAFQQAAKHPAGIVDFMTSEALQGEELKEREAQRRAANDFLNHYELVALSIRKKVLDEQFYKGWMRGTLLCHYEKAKPYIDERREKVGNEVYSDLVILVQKWKNEQ